MTAPKTRFKGLITLNIVVINSIHLRIEEKMTLSAGREGGLQSLECLGMIALRITEKNEQLGKIKIGIANNDDKGVQIQVSR